MLVFVGMNQNVYSLWLRPLGSLTARSIPGTDGGSFPFWSPDSRYIAFFAGGKLKKVPVAGGPPLALCNAVDARGGSWNEDNVIIFSPTSRGGLQRVNAAGGQPVPLTTLQAKDEEVNHRFPFFLPDRRHATSSTRR
jgi:hypothetical protein